MLEAGTVFTVVSLMMLANGAVLAIVARDFPAALRPAAAMDTEAQSRALSRASDAVIGLRPARRVQS